MDGACDFLLKAWFHGSTSLLRVNIENERSNVVHHNSKEIRLLVFDTQHWLRRGLSLRMLCEEMSNCEIPMLASFLKASWISSVCKAIRTLFKIFWNVNSLFCLLRSVIANEKSQHCGRLFYCFFAWCTAWWWRNKSQPNVSYRHFLIHAEWSSRERKHLCRSTRCVIKCHTIYSTAMRFLSFIWQTEVIRRILAMASNRFQQKICIVTGTLSSVIVSRIGSRIVDDFQAVQVALATALRRSSPRRALKSPFSISMKWMENKLKPSCALKDYKSHFSKVRVPF